MGVSRDWVNSFEAGKLRAELIYVLRLLGTLDLQFDIVQREVSNELDVILDRYRGP